jgi:hypothetical protein
MKKWMILLVTVLGFSSIASAQQFTIKLGPALSLIAGNVGFGANLGIRTPSFFKFSKTIGVGVRADLIGDFSTGFAGIVTLAPVVNFSFDKDTFIYLGPAVGLVFDGSGGSSFVLGADAGATYAISPFLGVYADANVLVVPRLFANVSIGGNYNLSKELSVYLEFQATVFAAALDPSTVTFNPGAGLGLFIRL